MASIDKDLVLRSSTPGPRYTSYPPAPAFHAGFGLPELEEALGAAGAATDPLSIYVHVPFCQQRCGFCGCNVIATRRRDPAERYLEALESEIALVAKTLGHRRRVSGVHLGGGTPTFLDEAQLEHLWQTLTESFDIDRDGELAIEVDPRATTQGQLELLRRLGFSRLSFGVQDLDPEVQRQIGRIQPTSLIDEQLARCRALGYSSINFDLLYGLPGQSEATLSATLTEVLRMRPDRIAIYGFAYLPDRFGHQKTIDASLLPSDVERVDLQILAYERLVEGGYRPVGFDHFALPGDELCTALDEGTLRRTFMGFTAWPAADCIGLGVSAISDVQGCYSQNAHKLSQYLEAVDQGRLPVERGYRRDQEDALRGRIIESLLCLMQADLGAIAASFGRPSEQFALELTELRRFEQDGLIELDGDMVRLTETGRFVARSVARVFDHHLRPALAVDKGMVAVGTSSQD